MQDGMGYLWYITRICASFSFLCVLSVLYSRYTYVYAAAVLLFLFLFLVFVFFCAICFLYLPSTLDSMSTYEGVFRHQKKMSSFELRARLLNSFIKIVVVDRLCS